MWRLAGKVLRFMSGRAGRGGARRREELRGMSGREPADLAIGAGEISYVLAGGDRGAQEEASRSGAPGIVAGRQTAIEPPRRARTPSPARRGRR